MNAKLILITLCLFFLFIFQIFFVSDNSVGLKLNEINKIETKSGELLTVAWSPDGKHFATSSFDGIIIIYNSINYNVEFSINGHDNYRVRSIAWSPNSSYLLSGACDNTIKVWNTTTGKNIRTLEGHSDCINSISWKPNGRQFATGNSNNTTTIWNALTYNPITNLSGTIKGIHFTQWSPNGSQLVTGSENMIIWNTTTWKPIIFLNSSQAYRFGSWRPDGKRFVTNGDNQIAYLWDTSNWTIICNFTENSYITSFFDWSADGKYLATGSADSIVRIWSIEDKEPFSIFINELSGHTNDVTSIDWHPSRYCIISVSKDMTIRIWGEPIFNVHITSLFSERMDLIYGNATNISAQLTNFGTEDCNNIIFKLYDNTLLLNQSNISIWHGFSKTIQYTWQTNRNTTLGTHKIHAVLIYEEKSINIVINGFPIVYIEKFNANNLYVISGKKEKIDLIIMNNGTTTAYNISVDVFDGPILIESFETSIPPGEKNISEIQWNSDHKTLGNHTFKAITGRCIKETSIKVIPRQETSTWPDYLCFSLIIILIIILIIVIIIYEKKSNNNRRSNKLK